MKYKIIFVAIERSQNQTSSNGIFITGEKEKLVGDFGQHACSVQSG